MKVDLQIPYIQKNAINLLIYLLVFPFLGYPISNFLDDYSLSYMLIHGIIVEYKRDYWMNSQLKVTFIGYLYIWINIS